MGHHPSIDVSRGIGSEQHTLKGVDPQQSASHAWPWQLLECGSGKLGKPAPVISAQLVNLKPALFFAHLGDMQAQPL